MDFHLKQWRDQQQQDESESVVKLPRLHLDHHQHQPSPDNSSSSPALPLFSPEPTPTKLSAFPPDSSSSPTRFPTKMGGGGGGYFSMGQWQELELQALIYRHMLTGTAIPPELLHLLLKKSLINSPSSSPYYQLSTSPFQPALMQSGYWGRGAMDPEPGRCRRTDGKKWRCSRDVVAGHKYCERHVHRGRNRSRKPVEIPTPTTTTNSNPMTGRGGGSGGGNGGGEAPKSTNAARSMGGSDNPFSALAGGGGGGGNNHFALSGHSPSFDLLHLNHRNSDSMIEKKSMFRSQTEDDKSDGRILRPFFDDWPRSIHEPDNAASNASSLTTSTSLSISVPGNPSSDFSLTLSTGDGEEPGVQERERPMLNWGMAWGSNPVGSMGGPLAEALRSSARSNSNSSPTSVLHQLQHGSTSEASYIST